MSEFIQRILATLIGTFIGAYVGTELSFWVDRRREKRRQEKFFAALDATMTKHGFERMVKGEQHDKDDSD